VTILADNRTGAGGNIGSDFVAKSRPDGYTLYFGTAGTHAINQTLYRTLPFHVIRDFTPIAHLGDVPNILTVSPDRRPELTDCAAVLRAARANPGRLNYASTGNGASTHLAGAQFAMAANIEVTHVPYRGQPGAQTALLGGDVDYFINQSGPAMGAMRQGQVRGLASARPSDCPSSPMSRRWPRPATCRASSAPPGTGCSARRTCRRRSWRSFRRPSPPSCATGIRQVADREPGHRPSAGLHARGLRRNPAPRRRDLGRDRPSLGRLGGLNLNRAGDVRPGFPRFFSLA
jgi:hypothetical protein